MFEVRGEVYMTRAELARINAEQVKNKAEPYKNARNLTAGTLKLLDPKEAAKRKLSFFAYGTGATDGVVVRLAVRAARDAQGLRLPGQPAHEAVPIDRRGDRVLPRVGQEAHDLPTTPTAWSSR